jgi:peptide/nickel transport system substrate-binding protein
MSLSSWAREGDAMDATKILRTMQWALSMLAIVLMACQQGAAPAATPVPLTQAVPAATTAVAATAAPTAAAAEASTPASSAAARRGGQIVYAVVGSDVRILNPILNSDTTSSGVVNRIFDPLVESDPRTGAPLPALATSWSVSPDGLTYTFALRAGVKFHDGHAFSAEDVKFTFDLLKTDKVKTVRKANVEKVKSIDVVDPLTVRFTLSESYCPFLESIRLGILPKHLLENTTDLNEDPFNLHPVGTGRFSFVEWVKDDHITLQAFDSHWRGRPNLDRWIFRPLRDRAALIAQLKTGEVDVGAIEPVEVQAIEGQEGLQIFKYWVPNLLYLGYNTRQPGLDDVRVRRALNHALDRKLIIDQVLLGEGRAVDADQPPDSWAHTSDVPKYDYDPQMARQLLDAAGWNPGAGGVREKDGQLMKYTIWTNSGAKVREAVLTIAQQQFKDVGVDIDLQFQDFASFINRLNKLDFDLFVNGFQFGSDPDNYDLWHSTQKPDPATGKEGFNRVGYSTPELDQLVEQGRTLPGCDQAKRREIYAEAQRQVAEGAPWNFLFQSRTIAVVNKRIVGADPTPYGGLFYNLETWTVR